MSVVSRRNYLFHRLAFDLSTYLMYLVRVCEMGVVWDFYSLSNAMKRSSSAFSKKMSLHHCFRHFISFPLSVLYTWQIRRNAHQEYSTETPLLCLSLWETFTYSRGAVDSKLMMYSGSSHPNTNLFFPSIS